MPYANLTQHDISIWVACCIIGGFLINKKRASAFSILQIQLQDEQSGALYSLYYARSTNSR